MTDTIINPNRALWEKGDFTCITFGFTWEYYRYGG